MRALCLGFAFLVALTLGPISSAEAEEPESIALLALEISGDAPPELLRQVQLRIIEGLAADTVVLGVDEVRSALASSPELIGCFSGECLERIGDMLSVRRFVRGTLVASGAHYELKLELLQTGSAVLLLNTVSTSCSICTIDDLNERSLEAAGRLLIIDAKTRISVTIASNPGGAIISIDGLEAGASPVETKLDPGTHRVTAVRDGYAKASQTIEIEAAAGESQRFEIPLVAKIGATASDSSRFGPWKWGALGASGTLLALGTTLIVIDDEPTCGSTTAQCEDFRQTMFGGVLSITAALAVGGAAGWMFWSESKAPNRKRPAVQLVPGGATAGMAFDF